MKNIIDILQVVLMFSFLIIPFILAKLWYWVMFFGVVLVAFAVFEVVALIKTGKTLSQQFGKYRKAHRKAGNWILICLALGWAILIIHLMG